MPDEVALTIDGRPTRVPAGCTVAAAVLRTDRPALRRSVRGEPRGPLCGMGICFECRVSIDGQPQRRSCQTPCRPGMVIETEASDHSLPARSASEGTSAPSLALRAGKRSSYEILVVGAGPAGLAAACCAAEAGRRVGVVDDNPALGGQIWRSERPQSTSRTAAAWLTRVQRAGFELIPGTQVVGRIGPGCLLAETDGLACELHHERLIVATGARELFLPFPGWTLPNVLGAGGLQALVKTGLPIQGKKVAVAGSGPLLLAVADYLRKHGADVRLIAEQAPWGRVLRFGLGLWRSPRKLWQALGLRRRLRQVRYATGCWPIEAEGDGRLASVTFSDGRTTWKEPCDYLACGFGLVPNLDLPALLGCDVGAGRAQVDELQQSSVPGVYCAGETTGIGGLEQALVEGQIAGYAAAGYPDRAHALFAARAKARRFARALESTFALRDELRTLARPDTLVCRCEDVPLGKLAGHASWLAAKLQTRCGMGPCQGRICGPAVEVLFGWKRTSVRPPIFPTNLAALAGPFPADHLAHTWEKP
jgi:NADPH-dependent 2,4-dienoyl-CoA reductase/sulfur reductase-like enzyme